MADGLNDFPMFLITIVCGAVIFLIFYISRLLKSADNTVDSDNEVKNKISESSNNQPNKKQIQGNKQINKKKPAEKRNRDVKASFNHSWLLTSLKGHSTDVLDMDFSANGKFLATCGEEVPDPGGGSSGHSSSSEGQTTLVATSSKSLLTRRQKKNRYRRDDDSPVNKRTNSKQENSRVSFKTNINNDKLLSCLRYYLLTKEQMINLGYPTESCYSPGRAIIFRYPRPLERSTIKNTTPTHEHLFDVNAREFVPLAARLSSYVNYLDVSDNWNVSDNKESSESSCESLCSNKSDDVCEKENILPNKSKQLVYNIDIKQHSDEKKCARCSRGFFVLSDGEYLTQEKCYYHWGKIERSFGNELQQSLFSCCRGAKHSRGCTTAKLHVWSGVSVGVNGPLDGYVRTKQRKMSTNGNGVFSLDCEMCYTTKGLELVKISVISIDGRLIYDSFVRPEATVIDYNTRFSGITAKDLKKSNCCKSLKDVQNDLMGFINSDTILIGHALENDLRVLKMIHSTVIDTSVIFPHFLGLPYRRSLKSLVNSFLKREIQKKSNGHDSLEDATACLELLLWRIKKDFKHEFDNKSYETK